MSHYMKVSTKISRKSCLIKALQAMGFKEHQLEYSETPVKLKGYQGDIREQYANLRIKGSGWGANNNHVGGASNDLGFEKMKDGTYAFHVSDYDSGKYNKNWQGRFLDEYARAVVHEVAGEQNFFIEDEHSENGEIHITLGSAF